MDAGAAVSHASKAARTVLNILIDGMDDMYILRCRFLHAIQKCPGDVHGIAIVPLGAAVQNQYLHFSFLPPRLIFPIMCIVLPHRCNLFFN
jgi:hypothetical protein